MERLVVKDNLICLITDNNLVMPVCTVMDYFFDAEDNRFESSYPYLELSFKSSVFNVNQNQIFDYYNLDTSRNRRVTLWFSKYKGSEFELDFEDQVYFRGESENVLRDVLLFFVPEHWKEKAEPIIEKWLDQDKIPCVSHYLWAMDELQEIQNLHSLVEYMDTNKSFEYLIQTWIIPYTDILNNILYESE